MVQQQTSNPEIEEQHPIVSTTDTDWSRVRTRAEVVVSSDEESSFGSKTHESPGEESYDLMDSSRPSISLQSVPTRATISFTSSGSSLSLEDAQSSIDAFFTNRQKYTAVRSNKLRFWQALCVEFGLVDMSSNPLPSFSNLEIINEDSEDVSVSANGSKSTSSRPSASKTKGKGKGKKDQDLPPLPTSLRQAKILLATKARVNLKDYMSERHQAKTASKDNVSDVPAKNFAHLVHSSQSALIKYTRKTGKTVAKNKVKNAWLQPMLREIY